MHGNPACQAQPDLSQQLVAALPRLRQLDGVDVEGVAEGVTPMADQVEADSSAGAAEGSNKDQGREGEPACLASQVLPAVGGAAAIPLHRAAQRRYRLRMYNVI